MKQPNENRNSGLGILSEMAETVVLLLTSFFTSPQLSLPVQTEHCSQRGSTKSVHSLQINKSAVQEWRFLVLETRGVSGTHISCHIRWDEFRAPFSAVDQLTIVPSQQTLGTRWWFVCRVSHSMIHPVLCTGIQLPDSLWGWRVVPESWSWCSERDK